MKMSESIKNISAALSKAQSEMSHPAFDSVNPHFRNKYASLASVRNAIVPLLAKHGVSVHQDLQTDLEQKSICCYTMLTHSSGEWMEFGPLTLPSSKFDAQGMGSSSTYARRYALQSIAGVVGDEDEDNETPDKKESNDKARKEFESVTKKLNESARKGTKALELAWKELEPEQRKAMAGKLQELKDAAAMQDAEIATQA